MEAIYKALEVVMNGCYALCHNYGLAIILFTLTSKIVLLPVSIWVQKNSIKMVKMQPEINFLMIRTGLQKSRLKYLREKNIIQWHQLFL